MSLWPSKATVDRLQIVNASHNAIEQLPHSALPALVTLDLSNNYFTTVPPNLGKHAPALQSLVLDENPIETLHFTGRTVVKQLSLRHMPLLQTIGPAAFANIGKLISICFAMPICWHIFSDLQNGTSCIELTIADCPMLTHIHADALAELPLCKVSVSALHPPHKANKYQTRCLSVSVRLEPQQLNHIAGQFNRLDIDRRRHRFAG